jgi:hypothetical protein
MKAREGFIFAAALALLMLAACNGIGGKNDSATGLLSLAIADTPVDNATSVTITVTGIEIKPSDNSSEDLVPSASSMDDAAEAGSDDSAPSASSTMEAADADEMNDMDNMGESEDEGGSKPLEFNFSTPETIDLMAQQGGNSAVLLNGITLPAGKYDWIRLKLDTSKSTITLKDGTVHPLIIPSEDETGLKLIRGFTVAENGAVDFTIDFDLRQSVVYANGKYILKPVLKLIDNQQVGTLSGTVANTVTIGSTAISDPSCSPAAYIFSGANVTPVDINPTATVQPVATASVTLDDASGQYTYTQPFLAPGDYTVALVCAANDDPTIADSLTFSAAKNATVTAQQTTTVDFP